MRICCLGKDRGEGGGEMDSEAGEMGRQRSRER